MYSIENMIIIWNKDTTCIRVDRGIKIFLPKLFKAVIEIYSHLQVADNMIQIKNNLGEITIMLGDLDVVCEEVSWNKILNMHNHDNIG